MQAFTHSLDYYPTYTIVIIVLVSVSPPPLQPTYLHSDKSHDGVAHSFKLHAASNRNGPITHYQLIIIPRGNSDLISIKDVPNVFFTNYPPQEKDVAVKLPHPRPYVASDFTSVDFPDVVTLVSPYWNATQLVRRGEHLVRVLWAGVYVSVCLRAFVESSDKKVSLNESFRWPVFGLC